MFEYIRKKYKVMPDYPWRADDRSAVFRHADNRKWFALVLDVQRNKLGQSGNEYAEVVNLKVSDMFFRDILIRQEGIIPAYHMNKQHWITVFLDGTVPEDKVFDLIDMSFKATASDKRKK